MKSDSKLQHTVLDELEWEPSIDASQIGVTATNGVVTLTGSVPRYTEKMEAERLAKSLAGVKAVANDIEVRLPGIAERTDTDIAQAAVNSLKWHVSVPEEHITVTVRNGWVTLEGEVEWQYQREAARDAVCFLTGVKGITNKISIVQKPNAANIKSKIEAAFGRKAKLDANRVHIDTADGKVTLAGDVPSWGEYSEAERVAWAAPGVVEVDNKLTVGVWSA